MTTPVQNEKTVGQLVAENPARSRVFEKLGIDYCCGGKLPLSEACQKVGLDASSVLATLEAAEGAPTASDVDPQSMSLTELCDHIESVHHAYLKAEFPRLTQLTGKVLEQHGTNFPFLPELRSTYLALQDELQNHMMKEEQILFPAIRDLEAGRPPQSPCGSHLEGPISVMEHEHDSAGAALERIRTLTKNYTAPDGVCNTFHAMLDALKYLETDLHMHIHKENNVLFPRALQEFAS